MVERQEEGWLCVPAAAQAQAQQHTLSPLGWAHPPGMNNYTWQVGEQVWGVTEKWATPRRGLAWF